MNHLIIISTENLSFRNLSHLVLLLNHHSINESGTLPTYLFSMNTKQYIPWIKIKWQYFSCSEPLPMLPINNPCTESTVGKKKRKKAQQINHAKKKKKVTSCLSTKRQISFSLNLPLPSDQNSDLFSIIETSLHSLQLTLSQKLWKMFP